MATHSRPSVERGIIAGLVGGVLGAGAMSLAHHLMPRPSTPAREGEDATLKAADALMRRLAGRSLPESQRPLASELVHYGFGAAVGALYGGVAALTPRATLAWGTLFGAAVWLGAHVITVPALGLAASPARRPPAEEAPELGMHLLYGAVTELTRRILIRI
jgi:uncharacterized membrane protein YagU involved in acid resistance